jgi:hypothetical protein
VDDSNRHEPPAQPPGPESQRPKFVGDAMAALLRSADVKVQRGDETKVLSRTQDVLADLERRNPGKVSDPAPAHDAYRIASSYPPRPRVDTALWIVLAIGLFAIAGWMLAYSL